VTLKAFTIAVVALLAATAPAAGMTTPEKPQRPSVTGGSPFLIHPGKIFDCTIIEATRTGKAWADCK
jgi:hypothetical protein